MKDAIYVVGFILAALTLYLSIACCVKKDYMVGDEFKRETESLEIIEEETVIETKSPETVHFEVETVPETTVCGTEAETATETTTETVVYQHYTVDGQLLDESVQEFLYRQLDANGVAWMMPYAMMQIFQESSFNPYAVSSSGLDHGILQYRVTFWPAVAEMYGFAGADIYDYYVQIAIYAQQMGERYRSGKSINEMISDHYTGGSGYSAEYVDAVLGHTVEEN